MASSLFDFSLHPAIADQTPDAIVRTAMRSATRILDPTGEEGTAIPVTPATTFREWNERTTPKWRWDWPHLNLLQKALDAVRRGQITRLIVQLPPRHGKSETATVRFPVMRLVEAPWTRFIVGAYNQKLANRFSRKARSLARGLLPLSLERTAAEEWETTAGGGVRAVGVGSGVTGFGADGILIDDPVKNRKEAESQTYRDDLWDWYREDLYTRLEPGGVIVLSMTRWHEDDLAGRILASDDAPNWKVLSLPALAEENDPLGRRVGAALCPDRYDEAALLRIQKTQGGPASRGWTSLYQQRPAPAEGAIIKKGWFRFYTTPDHPIIEQGHAVPYLPPVLQGQLQSWDMAFKKREDSDFVAGHVWGWSGANCYLLDRLGKRADFVETLAMVRDLTVKWPAAMLKLVEDKANGPAVISALRNKITGLVPVEPDGDKIARAYAVTPMMESGNVWLPHPGIAPWVNEMLLECTRFPNSRHDDDVDAMTQALKRLDLILQQRLSGGGGQGANEDDDETSEIASSRF